MDILKGNTGHISGFICALRLFLHVFWHGHCSIAKGLILGKFRLICRNKVVAVLYVVYVLNGKASSFFEKRTENLAVNGLSRILLIAALKKLRLQGVMSPQRAVASADENVFLPRLLCHLIHHIPNLFMGFRGLLLCKTAGVGQYIEQIVLLLKALPDAVLLPVGVNRNIMNRLHSRRVVVQYHNLLIIPVDFLLQKAVDIFLINPLVRVYNLCFDCHCKILPVNQTSLLPRPPASRNTERFRRGRRSYVRESSRSVKSHRAVRYMESERQWNGQYSPHS